MLLLLFMLLLLLFMLLLLLFMLLLLLFMLLLLLLFMLLLLLLMLLLFYFISSFSFSSYNSLNCFTYFTSNMSLELSQNKQWLKNFHGFSSF